MELEEAERKKKELENQSISARQQGGVTLQAYFEDHFWALIDAGGGGEHVEEEEEGAASTEESRRRRRRKKKSSGGE